MRNASAKLTTEQVISVKRMLAERDKWGRRVWSASEIARQYCNAGTFISAEAIRRIDRGESWGWLQLGTNAETAVKPESTPAQDAAAAASLARLQAMQQNDMLDELQGEMSEEERRIAEQKRNLGGGRR